jgi:hypothetical protein
MRNRTIETAATAIVVASLAFGLFLTMPSTSAIGDLGTAAGDLRQISSTGLGVLKQPERF